MSVIRLTVPADFAFFSLSDLYPSAWALDVWPSLGAGSFTVTGSDGRFWEVVGDIADAGPWPETGGSTHRMEITGLNFSQPDNEGVARGLSLTGISFAFLFGIADTRLLTAFNGDDLLSYWDGADFEVVLNGAIASLREPAGIAGGHEIAALSGHDTVRSGAGDDIVSTGPGRDVVVGRGGADALYGGAGDDSVLGGAGADELYGDQSIVSGFMAAGNDTLRGAEGDDLLHGDGGNDLLLGNVGDDRLDGGTGADTMLGGAGDDIFHVDDAGDRVFERPGGGFDVVYSSVSLNLGNQSVEALYLVGAAAFKGTGGALANRLTGTAAANVLDGGAGADTLRGGGGNDRYFVDDPGDVIEHVGRGGKVFSTIGFTLPENSLVSLTLLGPAAVGATGNNLANRLTGNAAANLLDGREGADSMAGGAGDDSYVVDHARDRVVERPGEGYDAVSASVSFDATGQSIEAIMLTGHAAIEAVGNELANLIRGNRAANRLVGGDGSDTLVGGAGADRLEGGTGDDLYLLDDTGDEVIEVAGGGHDMVTTGIGHRLAAEVEALRLTGGGAIHGIGNRLDNAITGNAQTNHLFGLGGNDTLDGGLGADVLAGGAGFDLFVFGTALGGDNLDRLSDFDPAADRIALAAGVFRGLAPGALAPDALGLGAVAGSAAHRILYDATNGVLAHDADGAGGAAAVRFAVLPLGLTLAAGDFLVF